MQNETNGIAEAIELAARKGKKVAINIAPADERMFDYPLSKVALIIVNELEAMALSSKSSPQLAFDSLIKAYPEIDIVLTLGERGLVLPGEGLCAQGNGFIQDRCNGRDSSWRFFYRLLDGNASGWEDLHESITLASAASTRDYQSWCRGFDPEPSMRSRPLQASRN